MCEDHIRSPQDGLLASIPAHNNVVPVLSDGLRHSPLSEIAGGAALKKDVQEKIVKPGHCLPEYQVEKNRGAEVVFILKLKSTVSLKCQSGNLKILHHKSEQISHSRHFSPHFLNLQLISSRIQHFHNHLKILQIFTGKIFFTNI